jgi:hypothetical protein
MNKIKIKKKYVDSGIPPSSNISKDGNSLPGMICNILLYCSEVVIYICNISKSHYGLKPKPALQSQPLSLKEVATILLILITKA